MKKLICALAAMMLMTGCSAVSSAPASSAASERGTFTPGTFTARAAGRNGDVSTAVTFSAERIEDIRIESQETESIGVEAMNKMKAIVLETQGVDLDNVAGATISASAFIEALNDCVRQAGADPAKLTGAAGYGKTSSYETEADIIVVGGGAAGMSAAIAAHEAGASVILLEKSNILGGNTVCATNGINGADAKVQLESQEYKEAGASVEGLVSLQINNEDAREDLDRAFAENSGETIDRLSGIGASFEVEINKDERNKDQNYYLLQDRTNGTTAVTLISLVSKKISEEGITVYYSMDAHDLVEENGKVTGVIARNENGEEVTFTGKAILLATGGFGQNSELVGKVNPALANAITDETAPTTGEGLLMAQAVGADAVNLDAIQTFPAVIPGYGMLLPFNLPGGFTPDAIYVNNRSERFTAEGFEIPDQILAQDKGEVYAVFDESGMNDSLQTLLKNGYVVSGDTAEELAEKLGLDGKALAATIAAFNEDISDGTDDAFGKDKNLNSLEGTLYGYRFGVGAHYFMGGILINDQTQVLNTEGEVIDGLYAAGEVTGGFHGTFRVDGSGLGDSFVFGRIAGKVMAENVR
ncbi:MAG: FAD-dependent oxidoreductase [Solobacterium sp.]|nr:FAD-dependent oxidoreductase [Solobacterium sp.]